MFLIVVVIITIITMSVLPDLMASGLTGLLYLIPWHGGKH